MKTASKKILLFESLAAPAGIFLFNLFFPANPGFASFYFLPYLLTALFFAAYAGRRYGFFCFGAGLLFIWVLLPFVLQLFPAGIPLSEYWKPLFRRSQVIVPVFLILIYVFGTIQRGYTSLLRETRERFRKLVRENNFQRKEINALTDVNSELEERLSRQQESIMSLYNQTRKIDTVSVPAVLETFLETVRIFTRTRSASVWRYHAFDRVLKLSAETGWEPDEETLSEIPENDTIEGWVVRNNQFFSVRMLLQMENLRKLDTGRNLITIPIHVESTVWGILNIEDIPFEKYNLYTERILFIITSLIEPYLRNAAEYEAILLKDETDSLTGLPLFSSFYKMLDEEIKRFSVQPGKISIIVLEIVNYQELIEAFQQQRVQKFFPELINEIYASTETKGHAFKYKEENQLGFIFPSLDFDGASLFCLEILEKMNSSGWRIDNKPLVLEAIIGFASYTGDEESDDLIDKAENLLEMQKL